MLELDGLFKNATSAAAARSRAEDARHGGNKREERNRRGERSGGTRDGGTEGNYGLGEAGGEVKLEDERVAAYFRGRRHWTDLNSECGRGAKEGGSGELSVVTNSPPLLINTFPFFFRPNGVRPSSASCCRPACLSPRSGFFHLFPSARLLTRRSGRTSGQVHKYGQHWPLLTSKARRDQPSSIQLIPTDDRTASPTGTSCSRRGRK